MLERQTRAHVLERIRAGVLEAGTVALLRDVGLGARMDREGHPHDGSTIVWEGRPRFFIDTKKFTGRAMMAYGQTAITEDLYAARDAAGAPVVDRGRQRPPARPHLRPASRDLREGRLSPSHRLRLHRRLRRLSRRQPRLDSCPRCCGPTRRAIRSAGSASCRRRRRSRSSAMLSPPRLRAGLDAQSDAQPLLHPVRSRHPARGLAGRALLGRIQARCPRGHGGAHRHRAVDREIDRAAAQLRRRADALRPAVPGRRCRPHRAADGSQGAQSRGLGRVLSVACARRDLPHRARRATSTAIPRWRCVACGRPRASRGG